jgi:NitT/TauT family transport system substrate-binding protein
VPSRRSFLGAAAAAATGLALPTIGGCSLISGSDSPDAPNPNNLERPTLRMGSIASVGAAALFVAASSYNQRPSFFAEQGLTVEIVPIEGGSAGLEKVIAGGGEANGELDGVLTNNASVILAVAKGKGNTQLRFVFEGPNAGPRTYVINCSPSSGFTTLADLAGQKLGVSSKSDVITYAVIDHLTMHGVDPKSVQFVEMPYKDSEAALTGTPPNLLATVQTEPYITQTLRRLPGTVLIKDRDIFPDNSPNSDLSIASYVVTQKLIDKAPRSVAAFIRAMTAATIAMTQAPQMIRDILPTRAKIDGDIAALIELPTYQQNLNETRMNRVSALLTKHGALPGPYDVSPLIYRVP